LGVAVALFAAAGQRAGAASSGLCAFQESITQIAGIATSKFHVVEDGCQVSLVSISKYGDGNAIFDTATGTFAASDTRDTLSVQLPCDRGSETDLILGPPTLYPPGDFDLGATPFNVACPTSGSGSTGGGGGGPGGGGSGGSGGGGSAALPDLATTVQSSKTKGLTLGERFTTTVSVKNKGKGPAGGVHLLISLSDNAIPQGAAHASRGPGCTGLTVLDCNLGSLPTGETATVGFQLSGVSGRKLFIGSHVQELENDETLTDNSASLTLALAPRKVRLKISAVAGRIVAGEQLAYLSLSRRARVTAQNYVGGAPQPIRWRRTLSGGTFIVRIPTTGIASGRHFTLVFRAKIVGASATTRLKLVR
jgi:hypothetical protein